MVFRYSWIQDSNRVFGTQFPSFSLWVLLSAGLTSISSSAWDPQRLWAFLCGGKMAASSSHFLMLPSSWGHLRRKIWLVLNVIS